MEKSGFTRIKPENVLLASHPDEMLTKIIDFGAAKTTVRNIKGTVAMGTVCGTPEYMAPELYEAEETGHGSYNKAVDIFALGLLYLLILEAKKGQKLKPLLGK